MSLVGNLEDLSLPDILQIVSLSRKSGFLMLEREGQQGKIIIRQGKVIQTVSPRPGKTLGELLVARGLLRPDDLKKALEIQRAGGGRELLGAILVQLKLLDEPSLEKVVQEQIEEAIIFFLSWREGTFSFELAEIKARGEFSVDPQAFILERGIDTQWLVLEGTRQIDERSRERAAAPAAADAPAEAAGETSFAGLEEEAAAPGRPLVLVDDDAVFRELSRDHLGRHGFRVVTCENVAAGLAAIEREESRDVPLALAADIVMPTLDNQGFLGGLELLEKVRTAHPGVRAVAVTAYPDDNIKAQVLELGCQFLLKPGAGGSGSLDEFFQRLTDLLGGGGPAAPSLEVTPAEPAAVAASAAAPPEPVAVETAAVETAAEAPAAPAPAPPPVLVEEVAALPVQPPAARPGATLVEPPVEPPAEAPIERPPAGAAPAPARPAPRGERERISEALRATREALTREEGSVASEQLAPDERALLREMLAELQSPRAAGEIGLLILRFAAELLNRAVLFVVKAGNAVGLGGFGVDVAGGPDRRGIRGITLPLQEPSLLRDVVRTRSRFWGPVGEGALNRTLLDVLGGKAPVDAVALPLVTGGKVRVILYGDNLPEQRPVAGVRALEMFLTQAGLTLEKALLEKKLQEADEAAGGTGGQHAGGAGR